MTCPHHRECFVGASITEASHDALLADGAHFSRVFKEVFGLTPSEVMPAGPWVR